jgi:hypothetical protein
MKNIKKEIVLNHYYIQKILKIILNLIFNQ